MVFSRQTYGWTLCAIYVLMKSLVRACENSQVSGIPQDLVVIIIRCIIHQRLRDPLPSDGSASNHAVRIAHRFHVLEHSRVADFSRIGQLNMIAHSYNEGISLLMNTVHILKCNVVSGSIISRCRDVFCCATKVDWEWGTIKMLCFHYIVDCVDDHTGSCD